MKLFATISILVILLTGCKKEKDSTPPVINITDPAIYSSYGVFDIFSVVAEVSDETNLQSVTIDVQNADFVSVLPRIAVTVTANTMSFSKTVSLGDVHLESGTHFIKVTAFDGINTKSEYLEISITALPLQINNMFIVSSPSAGIQNWYTTDGTSASLFHVFASEYGGAAVNSYHQYLYTMGSETDDLVAYHPSIIDTLWSKPNPGNPPLPYYHKMKEGPLGNIYISTTAGQMLSYGQSGTIGATVNSSIDRNPDDVFIWDDKIIVEQRHTVSASHEMGLYYRNSGALDKSIGFGNDIISWEVRNNDELYVFSNDAGGQGKMEIYVYSGNYFWEPHGIPAGAIHDTYRISTDQLIIAHDLGFYKYTYSTNSLIQIEPGHTFTLLKYDEVNNVLWCVEGSDLYSYDLNGNQLGYFSHTSNINDLLILYNK